MTVERFEDLRVWQASRELANRVYDMSDDGAFARDFGLKDQIRRASVSVMSNIAEGFESRTRGLFLDFLGRARGSAGEVRAQLYIAFDRSYISKTQLDGTRDLAEKVSSQLYRFMQYLESRTETRITRETFAGYALHVEGSSVTR